MTSQKVNDLELVKLSDYFTPEKFRTIPGSAITNRGGATEVQVVFNINAEFGKRLNFAFSTMFVIYGFSIMNDKLRKINKNKYASYMSEGVLKRITLNDCGERFVMVLELSDAPDELLAVTADEVEYLLNNCMHPAEEYTDRKGVVH